MDDETFEKLIDCWPTEWPGNEIIDLDDFGDCGYYLQEFLFNNGDLHLLDESADLDGGADMLTEMYLEALEFQGKPFDFSFFDSKEEAITIIHNDFKAFLDCWRKRVEKMH